MSTTFLKACRGEAVPHTPVWLMRQAGRYLPEYREIRKHSDFVTLTKTPDLAAEVTLQPLRRFDLDAAILFSDIMTPLAGMGVSFDFAPGPVMHNPIRTLADIEKLNILDPEASVPFVMETIKLVQSELPKEKSLIGFCGAPFTLFCYLVSDKPSKDFATARSFLRAQPDISIRLLDLLAESMAAYLRAQAEAGAEALMLFESWGGLLAPREFEYYELPVIRKIVAKLQDLDVPLIYFVNQGATLLESIADLDVQVLGIDWRTPLSLARKTIGAGKALQGNLDPAALFATPEALCESIDDVLSQAKGCSGHIFNLGHGIWQQTDPDMVMRLVDHVHERTAA